MNQRERTRMIANNMDRRDFLRRASILGGGVVLTPALLAACGSDEKSGPSATTAKGAPTAKVGGDMRLGTWSFYLDADDASPGDSEALKEFKKRTGVSLEYKVDVDGNDSFTATLEPNLKKGNVTGYDTVVLTSWMCARWIKNGWAEKLDDALIPNKKNLLSRMQTVAWDPNRAHTLPYADGQVGIAYYPEEVGFEIKSVKDLLDPRIKGKVTILDEMRDSLGMFMLDAGVDPATASVADAKKVLTTIKKARDAGQFRNITGNSYSELLGTKDAIAAIAWSGDIVSLQDANPDLEWVVPEAGQMSFVDTMLIPKNAKNKAQAHAWMNYLYDPAVSGPLFEAISYVSPVEGATDAMSDDAKSNPLISPAKGSKLSEFRDLTEDEAADLEEAFVEATQL